MVLLEQLRVNGCLDFTQRMEYFYALIMYIQTANPLFSLAYPEIFSIIHAVLAAIVLLCHLLSHTVKYRLDDP